MNTAAQLVQAKLRLNDEQIKFLDYVWRCQTEDAKDFYRNNYTGSLPAKYK